MLFINVWFLIFVVLLGNINVPADIACKVIGTLSPSTTSMHQPQGRTVLIFSFKSTKYFKFSIADYDTGVIGQNGNYSMICPSEFYIFVDSAFYGDTSNAANCQDNDALAKVRTICHNQQVSCFVEFSSSVFGSDPCVGTITGRAGFRCISKWLLYIRKRR